MSGKSIVAAIVAGAIGAAIWAFALAVLNFEFGIVAWLIGGMVGGLSAMVGGHGVSNGVICAAIAIVAIFAGKYAGSMWSIRKAVDEMASEDLYEEQVEDARLYVALSGLSAIPSYMVDRGYTDATDPTTLSPSEVEAFETGTGAWLVQLHEEGWSYDDYRASLASDADVIGFVKENLGLLDLLFLGLGVVTAFKLGGQIEDEAPAGPAAA
mgnify:FL=1